MFPSTKIAKNKREDFGNIDKRVLSCEIKTIGNRLKLFSAAHLKANL